MVNDDGFPTTGYATTAEVSDFLAIPERTLRSWRGKDQGPPWRKFGRSIRYPWAGVRAWAEADEAA